MVRLDLVKPLFSQVTDRYLNFAGSNHTEPSQKQTSMLRLGSH